ncbi:bifunctional 2',3'-cyclic-nucleotide 2'-phosphodiesterase/3'-nucleotidase [Paenibacillus spiritus]|nr:bifunctional 2',3'-cyclic-nucleotide 2'-phosphodiesterase/3'-nucleotidase [Paenibacillus spiritus]
MMKGRKNGNKPLASILAAAVLSVQVLGGAVAGSLVGTKKAEAAPASGTSVQLRVLSTTDVHSNVYGFDYFSNTPTVTVGLDRTASLIKKAREEVPSTNSVLLDNGDLIQGTPMATYFVKENPGFPQDAESIQPMIAALNVMKYDVATLGNHEFNYGLDFLKRSIYGYDTGSGAKAGTGANFDYINANVYETDGVTNAFQPYVIKEMKVKDSKGDDQTIRVGYLGLVTPQIMDWDKANLSGKVVTKGIVETARKYVKILKEEEHVDVVIAMAHSGFDGTASDNDPNVENAINGLSKVGGIDAITFSHTHKAFPTGDDKTLDSSFKDPATNLPYNKDNVKIDNINGHINGTPAVQAGYGGAYLGQIDLTIKWNGNGWSVDKEASKASTRSIYQTKTIDNKKVNIANVEPDQSVDDAVAAVHEGTIGYTGTKLGETTSPMNSYFAMVQDNPTVQIVTYAQKRYVEDMIQHDVTLATYKDYPILSVGAPFKAGRNGVTEYTNIKKGDLTIRSASDLYLYDNTLKALVLKGRDVKEWLEMSAGAYNQIKTGITTPQPLLNNNFSVFNFDVIDGIKYKIDVTKKAKYKADGTINDASSSRVFDVTYNDKPLDDDMEFVVVTNNYRASGGGNFPGVKNGKLIIDSQMENRQVLMDYISSTDKVNPEADNNWSIAPIKGNVNVTFTTTPVAVDFLPADQSITYNPELNEPGNRFYAANSRTGGFGIYNINLKQTAAAPTQDVEVHLLGVNDFHGQLDTTNTVSGKNVGTAAILATYLKQTRAKYDNALLFHNGDSVGASAPVSALERDEPTMEWMNMMGFDVGTLGNHEFDQGVAALKAQIFGGLNPKDGKIQHAGANFDYINANAIDTATGTPILNPYVIKEIGGVKIGFIGTVTKATPSKVAPSGLVGVKFLSADEEADAINGYAAELQKQGVETIVVLAHDPATTKGGAVTGEATKTAGTTTGEAAELSDKLIAKLKEKDPNAKSPIDVIVAGDNHALANGYVNGMLIVQAYSYGTAFEDIKLVIDPATGDVKSSSAVVNSTFQEGVTPDPDTVALVNKYLNKHPELTNPVGSTDGTITRTDAYTKETALGNLIADSMRFADFGDKAGPADFAFMNPGGIRADMPKGSVTYGDLAKIQPFGNTLVKLELTGAQIKTLLQQQWGATDADTKTLQISGLKYTANLKLPIADRVLSITKADGTPIDMNAKYTAVVNNFMADGGDNYKVLPQASSKLIGLTDLEALYNYIVQTFKYGPITAKVEGRITNQTDSGTGTNPTPAPVSTTSPAATPSPTPAASAAPSASPTPSATPLPSPSAAPVFKDLAKVAWAQEAVSSLASQGIIKGVSGSDFAPLKEVTRAEFITMIVRALNLQPTGAASFKDVKQGAWYTDAITAAVNAGIVKGSGSGKFEPSRAITREEMAIMIANALGDKLPAVNKTTALADFADKSKIASYAQEAVAKLAQAGIVNGVDSDSFAPKGIANRAQAAVIVYRMLDQAS